MDILFIVLALIAGGLALGVLVNMVRDERRKATEMKARADLDQILRSMNATDELTTTTIDMPAPKHDLSRHL